jgi:AcrR family transcriptional regulator
MLQPEKTTRNRKRTCAQLLAAARDEFAEQGYGGARVENIALRAGTNKRMIYYYFNNKEELFAAVLEEAYQSLRDAEDKLRLRELEPVEAIRALILFTWTYYVEHPEFLQLLTAENHSRTAQLSPMIRHSRSPLVDTLREVLTRGERENLFRGGVDPLQLYISIAALGYFYLSNNYTLSMSFGCDLSTKRAHMQRQQHIIDVVLGYLVAA